MKTLTLKEIKAAGLDKRLSVSTLALMESAERDGVPARRYTVSFTLVRALVFAVTGLILSVVGGQLSGFKGLDLLYLSYLGAALGYIGAMVSSPLFLSSLNRQGALRPQTHMVAMVGDHPTEFVCWATVIHRNEG